jgi:hypothetical protein
MRVIFLKHADQNDDDKNRRNAEACDRAQDDGQVVAD